MQDYIAALDKSSCMHVSNEAPVFNVLAPGDWCPTNQTKPDPCFEDAVCKNGVCVLDENETAESTLCCTDNTDLSTCSAKRCPLGEYCDTTNADLNIRGKC